MKIPEAYTEVRCYEVSCLPWGHQARHSATLYVQSALDDKWYVHDGLSPQRCLSDDGWWYYRAEYSSEKFQEMCYFGLMKAKNLARNYAPFMTVNGYTVEELLEKFSD